MNTIQVKIKKRLLELAEPHYQTFSKKLLPGVDNILGVRLPNIRKIAKELAKEDWALYLSEISDDTFEEIMLQGMIIGYIKSDINEILPYISNFIPKINNWSVCDSFCSGLKITKKYPIEMWNFLMSYLAEEEKEYFLRFGIVMLLIYYIDLDHIETIFLLLSKIKNNNYYVKMAIAWAISACYLKFPDKTIYFLKNSKLEKWVYNKAIQKIRESSSVTKEEKVMLYNMKRKN